MSRITFQLETTDDQGELNEQAHTAGATPAYLFWPWTLALRGVILTALAGAA
jgi:hypothetical protein